MKKNLPILLASVLLIIAVAVPQSWLRGEGVSDPAKKEVNDYKINNDCKCKCINISPFVCECDDCRCHDKNVKQIYEPKFNVGDHVELRGDYEGIRDYKKVIRDREYDRYYGEWRYGFESGGSTLESAIESKANKQSDYRLTFSDPFKSKQERIQELRKIIKAARAEITSLQKAER